MEATSFPTPAVATPDSSFMTKVFGWMFVGLAITGGVAALIGSNDELLTTITESPGILIGVDRRSSWSW